MNIWGITSTHGSQGVTGVKGVEAVGFSNADIVRHALVGRIVAAYDKKAPKQRK